MMPEDKLASPGLPPLGRRGFVMTSLITGFTLAAARAQAAPIHTDANGLDLGEVAMPVADGTLPTYFARPAGVANPPIVVVVEEIFGVHEYIKDVCRRLAKQGYFAIAPELYARLADLSKMTDPQEIVAKVISKAPDATMLSDLSHTVDWAIAQKGDADRVAVLGFCRGGRDVWLFAEHDKRLKAAVAFYGPVAGATSAIQPVNPITMAANLNCPLLGLYGGRDPSIHATDVYAAQAKAAAAGKTVEIIYYPDAGHGFHADYRPSYNAADAQAAWAQALAWLRKYDIG
ncbi:dienelactone hydrolase family protein [Acidisoma silvae]|uniref:Dienelactone hydrolase family protein n=2 Tax=Acidisoma silvae TaxID=2802396 RepID=A0A963YQ22_9PROT|nr:dienelactone hydrolase family protein [Acidisoma silvae]